MIVNMPELSRNLRIAISASCAAAGILFVVLWVRTIFACESVSGPFVGNSSLVVTSRQGGLGFGLVWHLIPEWQYTANAPDTVPVRKYFTVLGFAFANPAGDGIYLRGPYGLAIAAAMIFAGSPWVQWKARFSLRTLLIAMTLFAVALGAAVCSRRT